MTGYRADKPTQAERSFAASEIDQAEAFQRMLVKRQEWIDAYRNWAVSGAALPLLGDCARECRDAMALVYVAAREGMLKNE